VNGALHDRLEAGQAALGTSLAIPSPFAAELLAHVGFDFLMVDGQHGLLGREAMVAMLQAITGLGATPLVRVAANDAALIGAALDAGAHGVVVPLVEDGAGAARAAAACRYPPEGIRSVGPVRAELYLEGSHAEVNGRVRCIAMVETIAAVGRADEICSCPGIDGVMIGIGDLALSMGLAPRTPSEAVEEAVATILRAAVAHGRTAMIGAGGTDLCRTRTEQGFRMLLVGADHLLLRGAATGALTAARAGVGSAAAA
jgi:4-hydroxy-2-oxoheptanedioate aldolase